jgi:hypothetical protein
MILITLNIDHQVYLLMQNDFCTCWFFVKYHMHQTARDVFGEHLKLKRIVARFSSATIFGLYTHQYVIYFSAPPL